ncbi:MAG: transposase domain-containing protein [Pontiella sp.]
MTDGRPVAVIIGADHRTTEMIVGHVVAHDVSIAVGGKANAITVVEQLQAVMYFVELDDVPARMHIRFIGKNNWLFFGRTSAILDTLLETCRKLELNPDEYLRDILPRLPHMTNHTAKDYTFTMEGCPRKYVG